MKKTLLAFGLMLLSTAAFAQTPVTLHPVVEVNRASIRLADVFDGIPQDMDRDIAIAPNPGKSVTYDQRVLATLAETYRLDWQPQSLTDKSVITRGATRITLDMIQPAVKAKLEEAAPLKDRTIEVAFDNKNLSVLLPSDQPTAFSLVNFSYDEASHRFRSDLLAGDPQAAQQVSTTVTGRVVAKRSVPVLVRRLAAGTTLSVSDLDWITVKEEQVGLDILTSAEAIVGQELRHDQAEGEMLRTRDVMPPRLVTRGSLVTIKAESPMMLITAQGRALQDGSKGDVVRITNTQSNRVIEGVVEGTGVVRVGALQRMVATR